MRHPFRDLIAFALAGTFILTGAAAHAERKLNQPPEGFKALFNGKNLEGWWGWGTKHYKDYMKLSPEKFTELQEKSRQDIAKHWSVEDGVLVNDGKGLYATTNEFYGDFELLLEYKTVPGADSGIYLRGCPQVQIWDYTIKKKRWQMGSGGLFNNKGKGADPLVKADKPFGEWNQFRIIMVGSYVTVYLNDKLVVDHVPLDNFYEKKSGLPVPVTGPIQLQTHGGEIRWRNIFIRDIPAEEANDILRNGGVDKSADSASEGFTSIFNGKDFTGWKGPVDKNQVRDGMILSNHGTIYHEKSFSDFVVRFDFKLPEGGNNGLAIRYPGQGDTAYVGMCELQVLDNPRFPNVKPHQRHASAYGMVPALTGYLREPGEWNHQQVTVKGHTIQVELNGTLILDANLTDVKEPMYPVEKFKGRLRTEGHF
ncbi:MAG: DUF1080 domain-containing protein, partial [Rhodospirillales bacterium]|nr:DUF1080 domain-containing protein [Rhodospirillales bacterium]